jgi:hypothetical protein
MPMISSPCQTPRKHANAREEDPRLRAGDCLLEVLREASAAVEPSKRSSNHPAFSLSLEGADTLGASDDLNDPLAELGERLGQLLSAVHALRMGAHRHRIVNAACGPTLPSPASAWHGSYPGISCRQRRCGTTGENDPKPKLRRSK